jgi:hypothetical protein
MSDKIYSFLKKLAVSHMEKDRPINRTILGALLKSSYCLQILKKKAKIHHRMPSYWAGITFNAFKVSASRNKPKYRMCFENGRQCIRLINMPSSA